MRHAAPSGTLTMPPVGAPCPHGRTHESYARLSGVIRRIVARRQASGQWGPGAQAEDLLTAGAWRSPFLDQASSSASKSPRILIYNG